MPDALRKFLLVLSAIVIAGAITYYPWMLLGELTGSEGYAYFLTSIFWAPSALVLGLLAGFLFAFCLWPRKSKAKTGRTNDTSHKPGPPSIEA